MDELLSLFGGADDGADDRGTKTDDTKKQKKGTSSHVSPTNFGDAFGDAFPGAEGVATSSRQKNLPTKKVSPCPTKATAAATNNTSCDPLIGLRVVNRRTSRADMVDSFSPFTYKSCSMLAAASHSEWGTYLVDGGGSGGPPSGKTNLATCGILTSETSSRISKARRAFAILSLGDLPSSMHSRGSALSNSANINASISVFLFGDALSVLRNNKKYMSAGWAVAILAPNLMPPRSDDKNGGSTSVTLSVNDPRQILPIGKAADCDRCKGTVRIRVASDYGGKRWEDARCSTLVDLRVSGGYCQTHQRQGLSSSGNGGNSKSSNNNVHMTFMQRQKMQNMPQLSMSMKGGVGAGARPFGQASSHMGTTGGRASSLSEALSRSGLFESAPASLLPDSKPRLLKRAPLHMTKNTRAKASKTSNPYQKEKTGQRKQDSISKTKGKDPDDILGEALERKRARSGNASFDKGSTLTPAPKSKRPCKVFNTGEGFSGNVPVPKPSEILFQCNAAKVTPSPVGNRLSLESAHGILERQRNLAGLLKEMGGADASSAGRSKRGNIINKERLAGSKQRILLANGRTTARSRQPSLQNNNNDFASAFGNMSGNSEKPFDRDAILNAKSQFASAANAQEYARARSVVQELEAKEEMKEGKKSDQKDGKPRATPSIVTTGWACRTCKKKTPFKPTSCLRARHDVRQQREIKGGAKSLGSSKERLGRHGKDAEEGGLTLGSGLEWSGWRGEMG